MRLPLPAFLTRWLETARKRWRAARTQWSETDLVSHGEIEQAINDWKSADPALRAKGREAAARAIERARSSSAPNPGTEREESEPDPRPGGEQQ